MPKLGMIVTVRGIVCRIVRVHRIERAIDVELPGCPGERFWEPLHRTKVQLSTIEAEQYVRDCGENDGPESYDEAAEIFAALYGRQPDADDGDQGKVWSLCCAAVD